MTRPEPVLGVAGIRHDRDRQAYDLIRERPDGIPSAELRKRFGWSEDWTRLTLHRLRALGLVAMTHERSPKCRWALVERVETLRAELDRETAERTAAGIQRRNLRAAAKRYAKAAGPFADPPASDEEDDDVAPFVHRLIKAHEAEPIRPAKLAWAFAP